MKFTYCRDTQICTVSFLGALLRFFFILLCKSFAVDDDFAGYNSLSLSILCIRNTPQFVQDLRIYFIVDDLVGLLLCFIKIYSCLNKHQMQWIQQQQQQRKLH